MRSGTPDSVAFARDFYTVELRDEPLAVEQLFSAYETSFAPALNAVNRSAPVLSNESLDLIVSFVALQAVRTPRARLSLELHRSDFCKRQLRAAVDDPIAFDRMARGLDPTITDEEIARHRATLDDLLDVESLRVRFFQTPLVLDALTLLLKVDEMLRRRCWQLCLSADAALVTCDEPVILDFIDGRQPTREDLPGFGSHDSVVAIALGPRRLLLGWPAAVTDRLRILSRDDVAAYNTRCVYNAARFVFFEGDHFEFTDPEDTIVNGPDETLRLRAGSSR